MKNQIANTEAELLRLIRLRDKKGAFVLTEAEAGFLASFYRGELFLRDDIERAFSHACTFCDDCETLCRPSGCGTGYACLTGKDDGKRVCYRCADARQVADLKDRSAPFCAYLSSDGKSVTTWIGGKLMRVDGSKPCALSRMSYTHSPKTFRTVWATDTHGGRWIGRGSPGICIKLRAIAPTK